MIANFLESVSNDNFKTVYILLYILLCPALPVLLFWKSGRKNITRDLDYYFKNLNKINHTSYVLL